MAEISATTISMWERGEREISPATQKHLEESLAAWREGARS
jgi:transcriptional regulator with XRE-family HTH domain